MATAFEQIDSPQPSRGVRIDACVGIARWVIDLDHEGLVTLGEPAGGLSDVALFRVMENVRAKAVAMRWFGGGHIILDAADLVLAAPAPIGLDDGSAVLPPAWFQITDIAPIPEGRHRLRAVGG